MENKIRYKTNKGQFGIYLFLKHFYFVYWGGKEERERKKTTTTRKGRNETRVTKNKLVAGINYQNGFVYVQSLEEGNRFIIKIS